MQSRPFTIGIIGGGVAGFAAVGHLVRCLEGRGATSGGVPEILLFQKPRVIDEAGLCAEQRRRLDRLRTHGIDPAHMIGPGLVYDPLTPSLFTFNGDNTLRGFDFFNQRYDDRDFFDWMQANRELIADLYPDFDPSRDLQRHPHHDIDDIDHTSPRGAYGIYLHEKFRAICEAARNELALTVSVVAAEVSSFSQTPKGVIRVGTDEGRPYRVDALICATGNLHPALSADLSRDGRVFPIYPLDAYVPRLRPDTKLAVVGKGPSGIELALHASLDWGVEHVTLVSRTPHARLPEVKPTRAYTPRFFTPENFVRQPTARHGVELLKQELEACYAACDMEYPGWDTLTHVPDYPGFLERYIKETDPALGGNPDHPLALLAPPLMQAFYRTVPAGFPPQERDAVLAVLDTLKHFVRVQSRPNADLLLDGIKSGRLSMKTGTFTEESGGVVLKTADGALIDADLVVLATGFQTRPPALYDEPLQAGLVRLDAGQEAGLARNSETCRLSAADGVSRPIYNIQGSSLGGINRNAETIAKDVVQRYLTVCAA